MTIRYKTQEVNIETSVLFLNDVQFSSRLNLQKEKETMCEHIVIVIFAKYFPSTIYVTIIITSLT